MKAVKAHLTETNKDAVADFEKGAQAFAKKIVGNIKDYEFVRPFFFFAMGHTIRTNQIISM